MTSEERITDHEAMIHRQRELIALLLARVQELEARLPMDSHNSFMRLSTDGLKMRTCTLRTRSGMKPGGQLGHSESPDAAGGCAGRGE